MTRIYALAAALAALGAAACATPSVYGPATTAGGYGYSEQPIESDRAIVRYAGNSATSAELARQYALRRSAEYTLERGYDWFHVVSSNLDARSGSGGPRVGVGAGGGSGGGASFGGVGVGLSFPLGGAASSSYAQASLEIVMRRGPRPSNLANAYDARDVLTNMAPATGR